ncbi:MAG: hypothetical protein L6R41_003523 [Letrouitia leprolyta]|nr:MAG: hypothetical protein L6R41_003523 [Letrouitia leprolyta]
MSCPLSAILNTHDEAPQVTPTALGESHASQILSNKAPRTAPASFAPAESRHVNHNESAFNFPPGKGGLCDRRVRRKLHQVPSLIPSAPRWGHDDYDNDLDPPSHEMDFNQFNIFQALLKYSELTFEMIKHLEPNDLLSIYSISRDFHDLAKTRFTTMILSVAQTKAPESSQTFPFRCYRSLCIRDPMQRANAAKSEFEVRFVPGFSWLQMVLFREHVVDEIVAYLEREGLMLPQATTLTIKKIWFTMDLATNDLRARLMHNENFWTDQHLYLATLFITKLDMFFTCPITGDADFGLRKMLLGQRSLSTLAAVMKRDKMQNEYEMLKMIIQWNHKPTRLQIRLDLPLLGIPIKMVGMLQYEGWGKNPGVLFHQIDTLVTLESLRRGLDMPSHILDMFFYGFVDKGPGLDIWTVEQKRRMEMEATKAAEVAEAARPSGKADEEEDDDDYYIDDDDNEDGWDDYDDEEDDGENDDEVDE